MPAVTTAPDAFLRSIRRELGPSGVLDDPEVTAGHGIDWTGRFRADPPIVVRPTGIEAIRFVVEEAKRHGVALVPQGGNTGLVAGATPLDGEVVVDLRSLEGQIDVDPPAGQLTAPAGTTIEAVQRAAADHGWAYGVDLGSRATATVGGTVATDAGGIRFVRHGSTRRQLLGVRAVLGTGDVIDHMPEVEKDNTGYDLAALLCGSEGTLGIITAVRLRLVPPPAERLTAHVGFRDVASAVEAASVLRRTLRGIEAVELMTREGGALVDSMLGLTDPLAGAAAAVLLIDVEGDPPIEHVERTAADAIAGLQGVVGAAVATDGARRNALWRRREGHTEAINRLGPPHKFDVSLPAGRFADFVEEVPTAVARVAPGSETWLFGHAADGNVHVNVTGVAPSDRTVGDAVVRLVVERGGSISAEHGIGRAKAPWLELARPAGDLRAMARIRSALDPDGIMNPGVLVSPA